MQNHSVNFPFWILPAIIIPISAFHAFATYWHLYFYIWWLDIPVHIFGGFWVGLTALAMYYHTLLKQKKNRSRKFIFAYVFGAALVFGGGLELFEYVIAQSIAGTEFDSIDTLSDVCNDLIGSMLAGAYFLRQRYHEEV